MPRPPPPILVLVLAATATASASASTAAPPPPPRRRAAMAAAAAAFVSVRSYPAPPPSVLRLPPPDASTSRPMSSSSSPSADDDLYSTPVPTEELEAVKADLVRLCEGGSEKPSLDSVGRLVRELEDLGERSGIGQASGHSGLLSGEWELLYSPEDVTRSSPFFWAFRRAFPDESDRIFSITDSIPAPIKEVGPATQTIELDTNRGYGDKVSGSLVSRVKVATLGGLATSTMTTRASVIGVEGLDGLRLRVDTTKPEESTVLQKLGPLGEMIGESAPPFPSGDALERARPGSSEVVMRTTYCDEGLRISRDDDRYDEPYVWRRKAFGTGNFEI